MSASASASLWGDEMSAEPFLGLLEETEPADSWPPGKGNASASVLAAASVYSGSTRVMLASAMLIAGRLPVPLKITSAMRSPRSDFALCSPSTQLIASEMFDLPQPFGPTMATVPSPNSSRVRSAKDLNPSSSIRFNLNNLHSFRRILHGQTDSNAC